MEQRSEEWYAIRKGKMTASDAHIIKTAGVGLDTYIIKKMAEYYSNSEDEHFTNADMQRGIDLEPQARMAFEFETGLEVKQIGFVTLNEYVGCSPDGLIADDGLVEIKCPKDEVYLRLLLDEKIKPEYYSQMQFQMYVTNRNYCYYCVYNPNFEQSLYIKKVNRDEIEIEKIKKGIDLGIEKIKKVKEKIENGNFKI